MGRRGIPALSLPYEEGAGCIVKKEKQHYTVYLRGVSLYWLSLNWYHT